MEFYYVLHCPTFPGGSFNTLRQYNYFLPNISTLCLSSSSGILYIVLENTELILNWILIIKYIMGLFTDGFSLPYPPPQTRIPYLGRLTFPYYRYILLMVLMYGNMVLEFAYIVSACTHLVVDVDGQYVYGNSTLCRGLNVGNGNHAFLLMWVSASFRGVSGWMRELITCAWKHSVW